MTSPEQAPRQVNLNEGQPLATDSTSYGAAAMTSPRLDEAKDLAQKHYRNCCNEWVVAEHQFDQMEDPHKALMCARALRIFLIVFITMSTFGLLVGFVLKGKLESPISTEQQRELGAPSVVLCPSPWGTRFNKFSMKHVMEGLTPGVHFHTIHHDIGKFDTSLVYKYGIDDTDSEQIKAAKEAAAKLESDEDEAKRKKAEADAKKAEAERKRKAEADKRKMEGELRKGRTAEQKKEDEKVRKEQEKLAKQQEEIDQAHAKAQLSKTELNDTASALDGCYHVKLSTILRPHGKVAQYTAFDTVRLNFQAKSEDGYYNFAFTNGDCPYPQRWYSASLGSLSTGEITYDQMDVGASDVSEGEPHATLRFQSRVSQWLSASNGKTDTELEFFYGYFFIRIFAVQKGGFSVFALVALILLLAASINNCGLFELFFIEYTTDSSELPVLEPSIICQTTLGKVFACCRRRKIADEVVPDA